jgi:mannan endo-1,4-beta-mannosidase
VRRLGGNLMTAYNWRSNATNAGKDWRHANGDFLLGSLDIPKANWGQPAAVIETFLANSRAIGAQSLLTLPLAGFVAADANGAVAAGESAPSRRFLPVDWSAGSDNAASVNIPALLAFLVARHGGAASGGVRGYYLDNEPGLWAENHPRIMPAPPTIKSLIEKSLRAAAAIKAADPAALVLGPASWGATEMVNFQNAPDWGAYRAQGSFLAAYLDAFRQASERAGHRLLDRLDVHWYPFSRRGALFRTENPVLVPALLDAPRSLDEEGLCEDSWVAAALGCAREAKLRLPLLPSLRELVAERFPGTGLSIGEYNYGGAGQMASGLAVADALGRFGRCGVATATHWGSLAGWIGEAFRLYRLPDSTGETFGATALAVSGGGPGLSLFAARSGKAGLQLIALNKGDSPAAFDLRLASARKLALRETLGFDKAHPQCAPLDEGGAASGAALRLTAPPFSARRYRLA